MKKISLRFCVIVALFSLFAISLSAFPRLEKTGVLVLAHGGNKNWDKTVNEATTAIRKQYPVEVAFGMANPKSMQKGIDSLENQGVTRIVVVQLFISSHSPIVRQNEYLLGFRDKLADAPMLMDHSMMMRSAKPKKVKMSMSGDNKKISHSKMEHDKNKKTHSMSGMKKKMTLQQLKIKAKIVLTKPLDDHPMVVKTISDYVVELSKNPKNETIVLVAHGPNAEKDNKNWIGTMNSIIEKMRTIQKAKGKKFKQIFSLTVRDDAPKPIYQQAKEHLRTLVYQAGRDGDVIVIPLLLARGGVEARFVKRLGGLDYRWSGKTLLPNLNISKFIQTSVKNAVE